MSGPGPTAPDLAGRVRAQLADAVEREVVMFGGRAFMVAGSLAAWAGRQGDLLVRVPDDEAERLAAAPGASPALMGERAMGPDWLRVDAEAIGSEETLAFWLAAARRRLSG